MAAHPTWEGLGQGMLVLAVVWWAWAGYTWLTNALHSDDGIARVACWRDGGDADLALAIPQAFGADSVVFGLAYLAVRVIHLAVYTYGVDEVDVSGAIRNLAPGLLAAPVLIVIAGFLDGGAAAGSLDRRHRHRLRNARTYAGSSGFHVFPVHFHERFGLIVIIALGESIVATGAGLSQTGLTLGVVIAALAGLTIAACQWWAYFDVVALVAGRRFAALPRAQRNRVARDSYASCTW